MEEQTFLEAIRDRPGSRAERLVYADWLTDRGDPRGEFIAAQCEAHCSSRDSPRRLAQEDVAQGLLFRYEEAWLGPLLGVVGNWEWRGGLLDWVTVDAQTFLANADRWLPSLPLIGLHLRKARDHVAALAACPQLGYLTGLYLGDNDLRDDDLRVLLRSPHLHRVRLLYLQSNGLGVEAARALGEVRTLPRLRVLCVGNNRLGDEGVAALGNGPGLKRLRELHLSMAHMHEEGLRALAGSKLLGRLHILGLGLNLLPPGCLTALANSPGLANLRLLGYELNQPADTDVEVLAASPTVAGLRHLALDAYHTLGDPALRALATSPHLRQLRTLTIGSGPWGMAGARALARSRALPALRRLELTQGNERAKGVPAVLLGSPITRRLRELNLNVSRFGKRGMAALASHPRPLRLWRLDIPMSPNMLEGWEALLAKGGLAQLTVLTLQTPPPGALRAMLAPGRLPELRRLRLNVLADPSDEFQAFLDSPLFRQLYSLRINLAYDKEQQGEEVIRRLAAAWPAGSLRRLGLTWSLSADQVRQFTAAPPPPGLMELELGSFRMGVEGAAALANWPGLRRLRRLLLANSSSHSVPGLEALAVSPHIGPLLRVDIANGHVPRDTIPALRRRFGIRFAVGGRMWPRTITVGGWGSIVGDGED